MLKNNKTYEKNNGIFRYQSIQIPPNLREEVLLNYLTERIDLKFREAHDRIGRLEARLKVIEDKLDSAVSAEVDLSTSTDIIGFDDGLFQGTV